MNEIISKAHSIFADVQCDFTSLWKMKMRGETVEFITPYAMLSGEYVSVFITLRENGIVVSDGGRLHEIAEEQMIDIDTRTRVHYADMLDKYDVLETFHDKNKRRFHYKLTTRQDMISAYVYDIARFQESVANAIYLDTLFDEEESVASRYFKTRVKELLFKKIKQFSTPDNRFEPYADETIRHYHFTTGICELKTQRVWLGMSISRSNLATYQQAVKSAEFGFRHLLKRPTVQNPIFAAILSPISEGLKNNPTAKLFQADMDEWKNELAVSSYSYDQIASLQSMQPLFAVA